MSVVKLSPVVANVADIAPLFDKIMVYRSKTGAAGPFEPITTFATAIPIVAGQTTYSFEDLQGDSAFYYTLQYVNTTTGLMSAYSDPQLGSGDAAESILSVSDLKTNYLFGLDLTDLTGNPIPDSFFNFYIRAAVGWTERQLDIPLSQRVIVGEKHDWRDHMDRSHFWMQVYKFPAQSVQALRIAYPGQPPSDALPQEWLSFDPETGVLQVVPGGTSAFSYPYTAGAFAFGGLSRGRYLPDFFRVDYTAGFAPGQVPPEIVDIVGRAASFSALSVAGDLLGGVGVASSSVSIDGLSQSISSTTSPMYSGLDARIRKYDDLNKQVIPTVRAYYKGIPMTIA